MKVTPFHLETALASNMENSKNASFNQVPLKERTSEKKKRKALKVNKKKDQVEVPIFLKSKSVVHLSAVAFSPSIPTRCGPLVH